jgi:two-component system cell cycle response regulator
MSKKVLTIDDSKTLRLIVTRHLKPFGVEVLEAENGQVGLAKAQSELPDLILLDYNMPILDGFHTLVELKTDPNLKPIPVMMLTTETVKETVFKLIKLGLMDYIAKPFTRELLLQKVNGVLQLYEGDTPPAESELTSQAEVWSGTPMALIVDDKENVLKMVKEYLGNGFDVRTADTGQMALKFISNSHFDWLFLDLDLPDMNSTKIYHAYMETRRPPGRERNVIAMALRTARNEVAEARNRGMHDILFKPFTKEDVRKAVATAGSKTPAATTTADMDQQEGFLSTRGDIRILNCPDANDPSFSDFALSINTELLKEVNNMADEGLGKLIIKLSPGVISSFTVAKQFMTLLGQVRSLALQVRLVADHERTRDWISRYSEAKSIIIFHTMEEALQSFTDSAEPPTELQAAEKQT